MSEEMGYSPEEMLELWKSGSYDECRKRRQVVNCDMWGWEYEEEGNFEQDGKYQHTSHIIKHIASGRCFEVYESRSGCPFTEWYYTYDSDPVEVKKVKKVVTVEQWEAV